MFRPLLAAAVALSALAGPLAAQGSTGSTSTVQPEPKLPPTQELPADRGYDKDTARTRAVNAAEAPVTAGLNAQSGMAAATQQVAGTTVSAQDQARYDADMADYRAKVEANHITVMDDADRYARQQRAYADAMTAWRLQAHDCQKGSKAACNAPPPDPANFY